MSLSMYQASIPVFIRMLGNLSAILEKAAAYAAAKKIEPSVLINSRLAPDMRPLSFQIQIASDMAKGCAARLAGIDPPSMADTESTFPELQERIKKTIDFLQTVSAAQVDGSEEREVILKMRGTEMQFKGQPYLLGFVLPNFYFHVTTAYAILRHNGLDIGKADFLGVR
ncbi:hypothetical protein BO221_35270 [Archangium sp. Cb G35]|uniref:DUF1993 domain-containing protein n=1 Tax=Archangium sp. Cb G35 TaxID=1920190 RepID=UPI000935BE43|nr:DUF1993 domain-containing protein [Archangium sp. Cb G35]OJT19629.1 hypothetical protein BO221_35270 [Archangium sp. Cb G35]